VHDILGKIFYSKKIGTRIKTKDLRGDDACNSVSFNSFFFRASVQILLGSTSVCTCLQLHVLLTDQSEYDRDEAHNKAVPNNESQPKGTGTSYGRLYGDDVECDENDSR